MSNPEITSPYKLDNYKKRVSINNLYEEVIDPSNPRHLPVFINSNSDAKNQNNGKNHDNDIDLNFGFTVTKSSNYLSSSDPSKFFKFNNFDFVNENDRNASQLKSQFDFNQNLTKKQKLKNEKLPSISKDKSILKKFPNINVDRKQLSDLNSLAYQHPNSKFQKTVDHDDLTFKNTQININLNPNIMFIKSNNIIVGKPPQNKKKLSEMTDEEILALDNQFIQHSVKTNDMLAELENSIASSKFKNGPTNRRNSGGSDASVPSYSTKYTKDGINLTNFLTYSYPTRPSINYSSLVLQNKHEMFDLIRETNLKYQYPPKDIIKDLETTTTIGEQEIIADSIEKFEHDETMQDLNDDKNKGINKTVMIYINGTRHGINSLSFAINSTSLELLKHGDELVVFAIIPHDFQLLKDLLNIDTDEVSENEKIPLTRYKTSSMLDDLEKYNNKSKLNIKSKSSTTNDNTNNPKVRSTSFLSSPTSPTSGFSKQIRSQSTTIESELRRITTSSLVNNAVNSSKKKTEKITENQEQKYNKIINEKILGIGKNLMEKILLLVNEKQLILKITLEICIDKILHNYNEIKNRKSDKDNISSDIISSDDDDDVETSSDYYSDSENENAICDSEDDDDSFNGSDSSEDKGSAYERSRSVTSNNIKSGSVYRNEMLSRVPTSDIKKRRASSSKTIPSWKKVKKNNNTMLNLKFVIDNIVKIYNPELFIIGTKSRKMSFVELLEEKRSQNEAYNNKLMLSANSELAQILTNSSNTTTGARSNNHKEYLNLAEFLVSKTNLHVLIVPDSNTLKNGSSNINGSDKVDQFAEFLKYSSDSSRQKCIKYLNDSTSIQRLKSEKELSFNKISPADVLNQYKPSMGNINSYFKDIYTVEGEDDTNSSASSSIDSDHDKNTVPPIPTIKFSDVEFHGDQEKETVVNMNNNRKDLSVTKNILVKSSKQDSDTNNVMCNSGGINNNSDNNSLTPNRLERKGSSGTTTNITNGSVTHSSDKKSYNRNEDIRNNSGSATTPPTSTESSLSCNSSTKTRNTGLKKNAEPENNFKKKKKGFLKRMLSFGK